MVTSLEGHVTVTRAALSQPAPLRFKDDVFGRDRVATGTDAVVRILLGGRAVVTVRERSVVTISEAPGVATVDVASGRVAVAVARERMRQGDLIQVRTPNAVAGIRGTVVVAEVFGADHSVVTVLKGTVDVTRLEAGRLVGAASIVNALQRVTIAGGAPVSAPVHVAPAAARRLGEDFRLAPPRTTPSAATAAVNADEVERAARDVPRLTRQRGASEPGHRPYAFDDADEEAALEGRGGRGREKLEKLGRLERDSKRRAAGAELVDAVKARRSGRGQRGRD